LDGAQISPPFARRFTRSESEPEDRLKMEGTGNEKGIDER